MCCLDVKADEQSIDKIEKLIVFFQCFSKILPNIPKTQKEKTSNRCSSATPLDIIQVSMFIDFLMVFARTCNQQTSFSMGFVNWLKGTFEKPRFLDMFTQTCYIVITRGDQAPRLVAGHFGRTKAGLF